MWREALLHFLTADKAKWTKPDGITVVLTSLLPFPLMWMGGGVITAEFFICLAWGLLLKTLLLSLKRGIRIRENLQYVSRQCNKLKSFKAHMKKMSSYRSGSGRMGGRVCLRILAWPRLLSEHMLRMLSWSESMSCMLSRPWEGKAILGSETSWK